MAFDDITPLSKDDQLREVGKLVLHMTAASGALPSQRYVRALRLHALLPGRS